MLVLGDESTQKNRIHHPQQHHQNGALHGDWPVEFPVRMVLLEHELSHEAYQCLIQD